MPAKDIIELQFPLGGVQRGVAYQNQEPYTCPDALNVRPRDAFDGRLRGGTRPGLAKAFGTQVESGPIRALNVNRALTSELASSFQSADSFSGTLSAVNWSTLPLSNGDAGVLAIQHGNGIVKPDVSASGQNTSRPFLSMAYQDVTSTVDFDAPYTTTWRFRDYTFAIYSILIGLDNSSPTQSGDTSAGPTRPYMAKLEIRPFRGTNGQLASDGKSTVRLFVDGAADYSEEIKYRPNTDGSFAYFTLALRFEPPNTIKVFFDDSEIASLATTISDTANVHRSGQRIGVFVQAIGESRQAGGLMTGQVFPGIDNFLIDYSSLEAAIDTSISPTSVVASANGEFYYQTSLAPGDLTPLTRPSASPALSSDKPVASAQRLTAVYFADHGTIADESTTGFTGAVSTDLTTDQFQVASADFSTLTPTWSNGDYDYMLHIMSGLSEAADLGVFVITGVTTTTDANDTLTLGTNVTATESAVSGVEWRISKTCKVFDSTASTTVLALGASAIASNAPATNPPVNKSIVAVYRDRLCLSGDPAEPFVIYMSAVGDPADFDTSGTSVASAIAFGANEFGFIGKPITCLAPLAFDYMLIGTTGDCWVMRGDPRLGGELDNVSRTVGIVGSEAFAVTPSGHCAFLSGDGIYVYHPLGELLPWSENVLPKELKTIPLTSEVSMAYDHEGDGIHVFITSASKGNSQYWWLDWETRGIWPMKLTPDHDAMRVVSYTPYDSNDPVTVIGCRDGYTRKFTTAAVSDDGTAIESRVSLGPIALGPTGREGMCQALQATMAEDSGDVEYTVWAAKTAEETVRRQTIAGRFSGTWKAGLNRRSTVRARGKAMTVDVKSSSGRFAVEKIDVERLVLGRLRP